MSRKKAVFAIVAVGLAVVGVVLLVVVGTSAGCRTGTRDSRNVKRPSSGAIVISPNAFRFLMVLGVDKRFAGEFGRIHAIDRTGLELQKENDLQLYLNAMAGKYPAARANKPFLLLGQLPGRGHPSKYEYRVVKVDVQGNAIKCDLDFTYFILPGAGPSVPRIAHFIAEMPPLPEGSYTIVFKVITSYISHGDGKRKPEEGKRDHLARLPYQATFSIAP